MSQSEKKHLCFALPEALHMPELNLFTGKACANKIVPDLIRDYLSASFKLHLPSDEFTIPIRCPNHPSRVATAGRACDKRTDSPASYPL